jgi:hypothetical protein
VEDVLTFGLQTDNGLIVLFFFICLVWTRLMPIHWMLSAFTSLAIKIIKIMCHAVFFFHSIE